MRFNNFGNTIFGINITGQGINGVVEGTHVVGLRHLVTKLSRRLSLRLAALRLASQLNANDVGQAHPRGTPQHHAFRFQATDANGKRDAGACLVDAPARHHWR